MRIRRPIAFAGRFLRNWARTAPLLPWGRITLPHITRRWFFASRPGTRVNLREVASRVTYSGSSTPALHQVPTHQVLMHHANYVPSTNEQNKHNSSQKELLRDGIFLSRKPQAGQIATKHAAKEPVVRTAPKHH